MASLPTILLIEDNVDDYRATARSFEKALLKNPLQWCKSGQSALDYLQNEGEFSDHPKARPALILLDLNMPGLDGKQTLELIKQKPTLRPIPVIILTTSQDERDINTCYKLGASTYIQKPVDFDALLESIKRLKDYWFELALLPRM